MQTKRTSQTTRQQLLPSLSKVIGQSRAVRQIQVAIDAYHQERSISSRPQDIEFGPILIVGPPGLGKTLLGHLVSEELSSKMSEHLGTSICNQEVLRGILLGADDDTLIFVDEIHELNQWVQSGTLLRALEDRVMFLGAKQGHEGAERTIKLNNFAFVGATTDPDRLSKPLRDRFKIVVQMQFYTASEIESILVQRCQQNGWLIAARLAEQIARLSRGTPRLAFRHLDSVRRVMLAGGDQKMLHRHFNDALDLDGVDPIHGIDLRQKEYLEILFSSDSPRRLNVLCSRLEVSKACITKTIEPYLVCSGLIDKTDQGRTITPLGRILMGALSRQSLRKKEHEAKP